MRYRLILPLMFIGAALSAQEKCNAVVLEDAEAFVMDSPTSGTYSVRRIVQVNGEAGEQEAVFHEYTDQFRSLTAFKGTVERAGAKPIKLKKDDLKTVSMASGLAEDGFLVGYVPAGTYPYTVTYEYTMTYRKGIASFPTYVPVTSEKVRLEKGSYRLTVPAGTAISHETYGYHKLWIGASASIPRRARLSSSRSTAKALSATKAKNTSSRWARTSRSPRTARTGSAPTSRSRWLCC